MNEDEMLRPESQASESEPVSAETAGQNPAAERDTSPADEKLKSILESLLFAAGDPVSLTQLTSVLEEVPRDRIRRTLSEMAVAYAQSGRGFVLEEIAGGYQLRTPREHAAYVRRLLSARPPRLSRPLLETLAIIAYRQPITRAEIELLRGVDCGGILDTLIERNLAKIAGRKDAPGRPIMYATTPDFLELFGLKDLESLPDLKEFRELEGLRDPADVLPNVPYAASLQVGGPESSLETESTEQAILDASLSDSPTTNADEAIAEAGAPGATPPENAPSSTEAASPAASESDDNGESEDSH